MPNTAWSVPRLIEGIESSLTSFVDQQAASVLDIGEELDNPMRALRAFTLTSGKRFRPLLASLGFLATGRELSPSSFTTLSSLELVHVCALIHDDVMDQSDTRRGDPTIHRRFEEIHGSSALHGSSTLYGVASAILLGDLALVWAAKMARMGAKTFAELEEFFAIFDEMQSELMAGQFLDIHEQALGTHNVERSLKVARFKSAKYSIERPLHCGIALALHNDRNRAAELYRQMSAYGLPLGEAFQLRDDLLGVYGEYEATGKPVGDDLREGKRTALLALAHDAANSSQRELFSKNIGRADLTADEITALQSEVEATGAVDAVEKMISRLTEKSLAALERSTIEPTIKDLLADVAIRVTQRNK